MLCLPCHFMEILGIPHSFHSYVFQSIFFNSGKKIFFRQVSPQKPCPGFLPVLLHVRAPDVPGSRTGDPPDRDRSRC